MSTVGVRELKTRLGRYLAMVRQGQTIVVTDRGRPIAEIRRIESNRGDEDSVLAELSALGLITCQDPRPLDKIEKAVIEGKPLSGIIHEEREDRF